MDLEEFSFSLEETASCVLKRLPRRIEKGAGRRREMQGACSTHVTSISRLFKVSSVGVNKSAGAS